MVIAGPPTNDGHDATQCGGTKRGPNGGKPCTLPAGWGTDHAGIGRCKHHGGSTPTHVVHAQKVMAAQAVATYGIKSNLPPRAALLEEAQWSHGHVLWLRNVVQQIDPEALTWGVVEEHEKVATEFPGVDVKRLAAPNVWLRLYHEERKLHLDLVKTIETLKLEQGWQDMLRNSGAALAATIAEVAQALGHDPLEPSTASLIRGVIERRHGLDARMVIEGSAT